MNRTATTSRKQPGRQKHQEPPERLLRAIVAEFRDHLPMLSMRLYAKRSGARGIVWIAPDKMPRTMHAVMYAPGSPRLLLNAFPATITATDAYWLALEGRGSRTLTPPGKLQWQITCSPDEAMQAAGYLFAISRHQDNGGPMPTPPFPLARRSDWAANYQWTRDADGLYRSGYPQEAAIEKD